MGQLGLGVMLNHLGGNADTVEAYQSALNKTITSANFMRDGGPDNSGGLELRFTDGTGIVLYDNGQSCCENRYMTCDDDLRFMVGQAFTGAEIKEGPNVEEDYEEHETQFLEIRAGIYTFTFTTHNEHNGYYGGFAIVVRKLED